MGITVKGSNVMEHILIAAAVWGTVDSMFSLAAICVHKGGGWLLAGLSFLCALVGIVCTVALLKNTLATTVTSLGMVLVLGRAIAHHRTEAAYMWIHMTKLFNSISGRIYPSWGLSMFERGGGGTCPVQICVLGGGTK